MFLCAKNVKYLKYVLTNRAQKTGNFTNYKIIEEYK